jgi:hypothetical protein
MAGILLGCALIPASVIAQQVYKWTDSNGQTHYSDHAPTGQTAAAVNIPKAPPKPAVTPPSPVVLTTDDGDNNPTGDNGKITPGDPEVLARQGEKLHATVAAMNNRGKPTDQELVTKCKAQRDNDCNRIDDIKKREAILNEPPHPKKRCSFIVGVGEFCDDRARPPAWQPPHTNSVNILPPATKKKSTSKYTISDD